MRPPPPPGNRAGDWAPLDVPPLERLARPVVPRAQNLPPRHAFPLHTHRWHQLVHATRGSLVVRMAGSRYVITPEQAIWIPSGVEHAVGTFSGAEFRNLYVADAPALRMPADSTVYSVTPLLRALIVELEQATRVGEPADYLDRLDALIFAQLERLTPQAFHLPWPSSAMLRRLCEALYENPADGRDVEAWGRELGASARTITRRFERETGLGLREWRHRLRLFLAIEWLYAGRGITAIALALGYASPSAFSHMFRSAMGCAPSAWRAR